jgi:hypothetical protein
VKIKIILLREILKGSIPLFLISLSFVLKQFEFGGCSFAHLHSILKNKNAKHLDQFAASKLKTIPGGNENHGNETLKKFMLEIRFSIFIP